MSTSLKIVTDQTWEARASCYGLMDDTFFPADNGKGAEFNTVYRVCYDCPVKMMCRVAGIGERDGIWGGASPTERQVYRRFVTPLIPDLTSYEWDERIRAWTDAVLYRVDYRGMDLTDSLAQGGLGQHEIDTLFALTNGDRVALRFLVRQEEVTTMEKKR
jgi:WhiB family redox-sensing transcriptional regulator